MELGQELEETIRRTQDLAVLRQVLVRFRDAGGTQEKAYKVVLALLNEASDDVSVDILTNLGDWIAGVCRPAERIWPAVLNWPTVAEGS